MCITQLVYILILQHTAVPSIIHVSSRRLALAYLLVFIVDLLYDFNHHSIQGVRERFRDRSRVGVADLVCGVLPVVMRGALRQGRSVPSVRSSSHMVPKCKSGAAVAVVQEDPQKKNSKLSFGFFTKTFLNVLFCVYFTYS